jgi:hypothetical protein
MAKGKTDVSTLVGELLEEQDGDVLCEGILVFPGAHGTSSWRAQWRGSSARTATSASDRQTYRNGSADLRHAGGHARGRG